MSFELVIVICLVILILFCIGDEQSLAEVQCDKCNKIITNFHHSGDEWICTECKHRQDKEQSRS